MAFWVCQNHLRIEIEIALPKEIIQAVNQVKKRNIIK